MHWQHHPTFVSAKTNGNMTSAGHILRDQCGGSIVAVFSGEWQQFAADEFRTALDNCTLNAIEAGRAFEASVSAVRTKFENSPNIDPWDWGFTGADGGAVCFSSSEVSPCWLGHTQIHLIRDGAVIYSCQPQSLYAEFLKQNRPLDDEAKSRLERYRKILVRHFVGGGPHDQAIWSAKFGDRVIICSNNVEQDTIFNVMQTQGRLTIQELTHRLTKEIRSRARNPSTTFCVSEAVEETDCQNSLRCPLP